MGAKPPPMKQGGVGGKAPPMKQGGVGGKAPPMKRGLGARPPPMKGGLGAKPLSLEMPNSVTGCYVFRDFSCISPPNLPDPKPPLSQHVPPRLLGILRNFDSPHP